MQSLILRTVVGAITLFSVLMPIAAASAAPRHPSAKPHRRFPRTSALPADYGAWSRVASCESGGWRVLGYAYPDSLGISRANWLAFGGTPLSPGPVSAATRAMEIRVADRLIAHYQAAIPDQWGCTAW